jgi:hypothetical protein
LSSSIPFLTHSRIGLGVISEEALRLEGVDSQFSQRPGGRSTDKPGGVIEYLDTQVR